MEASNFFSRLLKQPKSTEQVLEVDDIGEFDKAWRSIQVRPFKNQQAWIGLICRIRWNTRMKGS